MGSVPITHDDKVLVLCGPSYKIEEEWGFRLEDVETPEGYTIYVNRKNDFWADWVVLNKDLGWFDNPDVDHPSSAVLKISKEVDYWIDGLIYFVAEVDKKTMDVHFLKYDITAYDSIGLKVVKTKFTDSELASLIPMDMILEEVRLNM